MFDAEKLYYLKGQLIAIKYMGNSYNPYSYTILTQYNLYTGKGDFVGNFTRDNAIRYIKTQFYLFRYRDNKSFAKAMYDSSKKRVIYDDGKLYRLYVDGHIKQIEDFKFPIMMRY